MSKIFKDKTERIIISGDKEYKVLNKDEIKQPIIPIFNDIKKEIKNREFGTVVNCKVSYIRPKYDNLEEWMKDSDNVYIGRGGVVFINGKRFPNKSSEFCNPFKEGTLEERLSKYREYITEKLDKDQMLVRKLMWLKGKNLGCWCKPNACHGDILLELIQKYN
jgi:hypothetical protein